ncbi:LOW QUALITY PROTEIN: polycystin-1 [Oncorhynchus kisutch]|uniref:LOW QUALITY PROTEIN: polycystin-1 n=1 Tax=Oncorhynchus kisutch TaxID=8019 RepID=UPI0012DBD288|nr:LOW QUALITY PROTEIN: polycystin-1-like [Oncorhynchus kisutch]
MDPSTSTPLPSTSCPPPQQWCPFLGRCLPLASPCHPGSCANCTQADTLPPGALRPSYSLVDEVVVTLPAGPVTHILVRDRVEDLLVSPGDIIGLQHDAGPASLLRCDPSPQSPWRQPILALNQSDWLWANSNQSEGSVDLDQSVEITLEDVRGGVWAADVVCPIRVLYVGHSETQLQGSQLSSGLPQPGLYSLEVTSDDPAFPVMASCPIRVVPPLGLTVLHPPSQNGTYYFRPNQTVVLLRVHSQYGAKAHWQGSNQSVLFQDHCPPDFLPTVGECRGAGRAGEPGRGGGNQSHSLFAVIDLGLGEERGPVVVNLSAHSEVTEASLSLLVGVEEPLRGLVVQPHPRHRVLMESVVSYTAAVEGGSSPTFKWTVDDKPYFTYYNTVLNIIYQNPAVYKLSVTAMNHVSNLTDHFNVTVDRMNPMVNLTVTGVPGVVTQGSDQFLTTSVVLDVSVDATFRWSFGDGGYQEYDFKPPYNTSLYPPLPDSPTQVLLPNKVKYKYQQPGVYTVLVSVSNHYENRTQRIDMHVYSVLTHVDIETEPRLLQAGQPAAFEAHALPSAYGIVYTWDFADGSASREGPQRRVNHTYGVGHSGVHNVCVSVNNTISWTKACAEMLVYEEIKGLTATSSAPTELNTPTTVSAHLQAGNNVTWSFDMGDVSMVTTAGSEVPHTYVKDGNYTVNVTARNAVSARWTLVPVQVFVLQVVRLEPAGCVRELTQVDFQAFVSGNASSHLYEWSFGDGTPNQTHLGSPRISHSYGGSGDYHLSLLLSSGVNKANFFAWVCVQPAVSNVTLTPEKCNFRLGEESRFRASARPDFDYTYLWDFGVIEDSTPVQGHKDMVFTYKNPGQYLVTVTVSNNISCSNDSVLIQIQRPVGLVLIQHNGTRSNNLTLREVYLFTTSSLAPASLYTWDFGDGTPLAPGPNATHAYNVSGVFNVTLTAANPVSSNHTCVAVAVLAPIRGLVVNADRVNVPINATVNFKAHLEEGDGVRFSWNLCDGCTPRLQEWKTHYTFRSVGTYNVIVTAESDVGSAQASVYIYVLRELEGLQIQPEEEMGGEGGCCYATNRVLHLQAALREGTNMSFTWNLLRELAPVSTALNLSGKTIPVNFSTPGPCDVFLRATNLLGTLAVNRTIQFLDPVGELYLETSVNPVAVNSSTNLTVLASKGSDLQYQWSADEGALGWNEPSVIHRFTVPGMKVVTVEVSNEVSADTVSKFIDVQEVVTGVTFSATNVTEQNFVATGVNVSLHGELRTGTNVSWTWLLLGRTEMGRRVSHVFQEPGPFTVMLNATNDVSGEAFSRELTVQDKIQGLELRASKRIAAVGERVEFTIAKASGTNVSFILSISGDSTVFGLNQTYVHQFSRVDTYMVNLTAHNQVSSERRHLQVEVMEPVSMLSILDCCDAAMPVGVKKTLVAEILTGNPVTFLWTFDLNHLPLPHIGKEVTYIPDQAGSLTIYLRAFNLLNGQNITKHIQVQNVLTEARVEARPRDTFINKTVMLMAGVTPQSTPVTFLWDFRDGSAPLLSTTSSVEHVYAFPGQYLVQVNCSNLVSWVVARVEVTIRVLECEEPEVHVVQAPRLAIWRYQPTLVEASVDLKACIRYGAQYLWEIFSTPHCNYDHSVAAPLASKIPLPGEVDVRRLQLSLPKMALRSGNYSLVFSLSYQGVPLRKAACLQLTVMAARLVPIIEGGTYRVWSKTQDLQLSAEQSYDPNMSLDNQSLLHYHWDCVTTSKGPSYCSSLNFGLGSSGPVLGIPGSELQADVEYTFRLTVRKEGMAPESTTQTVLVQSGRIPMVYLECVSCKAQSIFEVSQNSYVYLAGTCTNCHHFHRGRWTAVTLRNETLVLDSSSTTTGRDSMNLVLRQGFLQDGHSYVFTLHVTDGNMDREGVASITLQPNMPPAGGDCDLRVGGGGEGGPIRTLVDRVYFNCSGYSDLGVSETPLLYSLLVTRCSDMHCEEFCVYKGTSPEHSAFLPPGFRSGRYRVSASITVEDHQGAAITALNKSVEVVLPDSPPGYSSLPHWLSKLTSTTLRQLLKQGDSQRVRELSLALITVLNEYEQTRESPIVSRAERGYRVIVRSDITRALTALDLTTVNDIQQTSAALAQCTAVSREFICEECQNSTLNKLELMLNILETDTKQGTVTPTEIADNILNIMGDLIHQVSQSASQQLLGPPDLQLDSSLPQPHQPPEDHPLRVAAKAYNLSSALMRILMHSRVLNEEPLVLRGTEIAATGKRADPQSLFCYPDDDSPECRRFSIPRAFNNSLSRAATSVVQLMFQVEPNPFPFNFVANYTVSTEVASMEFRAENGSQIPISDLDDNQAITVAVNNGSATDSNGAGVTGVPLARAINVSRCDSVIVRVSAGNANQQAGLFIQLNFTTLDDGVWSEVSEADPSIMTYLHSSNWPNEFNFTDRKRITLSMTRGRDLDHRKYTFFLSPESHDTTLDYYVNVTTGCTTDSPSAGVRLEVGVFTSLCQYFSESTKLWRTDGMVPLAETNASRAVCSTRHLTAFAASLFVPPDAVTFIRPERGVPSLVVLLTCVVGLLCYAVAAAILHKLDQLDLRRAGTVPLCGHDGTFKYEVQVKTGFSRGAGTSAHVGISVYGCEGRSGHRHLDSPGAFARNGLDIFHIATETSLGSVWKIRVWHDNKGLSPAWKLQYVLVKDLQTGSSYYFLVEEWLSVDNERTDGGVEIEVEVSEEAELRRLPRLLNWELQRALCESHLWLSLWERPVRSPFTRLQRATCCALLLQLCLLANTMWYSTVANRSYSSVAVSSLVVVDVETVAVGVVSCLVIYPLYLLVFTLFRMSRSKCVSVEQVPSSQVDQESVEIDDFLDNSMAGSSFLIFNGVPGETYSEETNVDLPPTPSTKSVQSWGVVQEEDDDEERDWPELLSDMSEVGGAGLGAGLPKLKRGQGSRHLGVDMTLHPDNDDLTHRNKYFTSSDEDLIKRILADGQLQVSHLCDPQHFFSQRADSETADLSSIFGDKTEVVLLQKMNEPLSLGAVKREPPRTAFTSRTVVTDVCSPRRFPPWCGQAALWGSWSGLVLANGLSVWAGRGFSDAVALMWLISCIGSFLSSCLLLEPIKVLLEGLYFALWVKRLRPEEQDVLVECPRVDRVVQRVPRVRPPQGFALSQARQQARKVHMLHNMLKNFLVFNTVTRTRAVFVEFSLYNTNTDLLAFFSFLFEFPVSEHTQSSLDLLTFRLQPITGLDLQLQLTILLFSLVVYFCVCAVLGLMREGWVYLLCPWRLLGACSLALAACVCGLHISRCAAAGRLWASYLRQRDGYTDFYPLARQSQAYTLLSAMLLFILVLKASHQLRFLREWAVFGRALRRSVWELIGTGLVLLVLLLAYSHTGHLLFHSVMDGYGSVSSACLSLLGAGGRGLLSLRPSSTTTGPSSSASSLVFHVSFAVLRLALLWLVTSALLRNYRRARAELYRPVVDLQDYEMVELFLRRLKMWMGLSRTKEFRHKVRFEGMEPPPSRSSSTSDCQSLCLPPLDGSESPPGSLDGTSEASWRPTSSSPCSLTEAPGMGLSLGPGGLGPGALAGGTAWRERAETEATLKRLLPTLDALLQQLDRVTVATEELYRTECVLERAQRKGGGPRGGKGRRGEEERGKSRAGRGGKGRRVSPHIISPALTPAPAPVPLSTPALPSTPAPSSSSTPATREWDPPTERETLPPSSLFNHPAHTTTIPTRKRKPPPLKNKVHPNPDRHVSGHPKP